MNGRMELPNISPQAIELNRSCSRQFRSNRLDIVGGNVDGNDIVERETCVYSIFNIHIQYLIHIFNSCVPIHFGIALSFQKLGLSRKKSSMQLASIRLRLKLLNFKIQQRNK